MYKKLVDKKYIQVFLLPVRNLSKVIILIEIYEGLTIRIGRFVVHLFGRRWLLN